MTRAEDVKPGDIIYIWWDTGAMGPRQWLGRVVRVNRKTVTCLMEGRDKPGYIRWEDIWVAGPELASDYREG